MKTQSCRIMFLLSSSLNYFAALAEDRIVCPRAQPVGISTYLNKTDPLKPFDFTELSGLGFSPTLVGPSAKPLVYGINDGGGGRRMGIWDSGTGERLRSLRMPRNLPWNMDYESMTVGSCGIDDGDCIYIADVGDNIARHTNGRKTAHPERDAHPIYKIREPKYTDFEDDGIIHEEDATTLWFDYMHPTSPTNHSDCEAVFLDNVGWGDLGQIGDFYLITKWNGGGSGTAKTLNRLFKIPAKAWEHAKKNSKFVFSPTAVGFYDKGESSNALMGHVWTRGEMTLDGTVIALGDYLDQYLFLRCPGMSVAQALAVQSSHYCETWKSRYDDGQFETIAWAPDSLSTLEVSECSKCEPGPPMVWTSMDYTFDSKYSVSCPTEDDNDSAIVDDTLKPCVPGFLGLHAKNGPPLLHQQFFVNTEFNVIIKQQGDGNLVLRSGLSPDDGGDVLWASGAIGNASSSYYTVLYGDSNLITFEGTTPENRGEFLWKSESIHADGDYFLGIDCDKTMISIYSGKWKNENDTNVVYESVWSSPLRDT